MHCKFLQKVRVLKVKSPLFEELKVRKSLNICGIKRKFCSEYLGPYLTKILTWKNDKARSYIFRPTATEKVELFMESEVCLRKMILSLSASVCTKTEHRKQELSLPVCVMLSSNMPPQIPHTFERLPTQTTGSYHLLLSRCCLSWNSSTPPITITSESYHHAVHEK